MIATVTHKYPMQIAEGKASIIELCKSHGFECNMVDNNTLVIQDDIIDPRYDMVLVQPGAYYVEFEVVSKEEYSANYDVV